MIIVMPLAGKGSRFLALGYTTPKPLIKVKGKPMIQWAFDSVSKLSYDKIIFIIREEQEKELAPKLKKMYSKAVFVYQKGFVDGAVLTVLFAKKLIDNNEELIIYNPDQYFAGPSTDDIAAFGDVSGLISTFHATHPKWSFAEVGADGYVTRVAEKEPISTHATVGLYYFKRGKDFVWAANQMIKKDIRVNNEFYVCPVYNQLIERGDKIKIIPAAFMWGLGTPEDVEHFEKYYSPENEHNKHL